METGRSSRLAVLGTIEDKCFSLAAGDVQYVAAAKELCCSAASTTTDSCATNAATAAADTCAWAIRFRDHSGCG